MHVMVKSLLKENSEYFSFIVTAIPREGMARKLR
jgi:hypothetical protein